MMPQANVRFEPAMRIEDLGKGIVFSFSGDEVFSSLAVDIGSFGSYALNWVSRFEQNLSRQQYPMTEKRPQRRLAAILAADVVGYTRLMDLDEAGTLIRLKTLRRELLDPRTVGLWRPHLQKHRRWCACRVFQRHRRGSGGTRHPARTRGTERKPAGGAADRAARWHQPR